MRRPILFLLIIAGIAPQGWAWKSKKYLLPGIPVNASAHESQTQRAVALLQASNASNAPEWTAFRSMLLDASGSLIGDSNAHGNIISLGERESPDGSDPIPGETAIAYNGGPFYRYWIRAVESHGQVSGDVGQSVRRFQGSTGRSNADTYRYFGYLAHLVEDQCVPAHACNVRHGPWEGVEWWHWQSTTSGGGGLADPLPVAQLTGYVGQVGWDTHPEFLGFWQGEKKKDSDRGLAKDSNNTLFNGVHGFLKAVVQDTRNRWVPGLADRLTSEKYFDPFSDGGHVLTEPQLLGNWAEEDLRDIPGYTPSNTDWYAFVRPLRGLRVSVDGIQPSVNYYQARPQVRFDTGNDPGSVWVGGGWRVLGNNLGETLGIYGDLNKNTSPWLPYPQYSGEAFDGRWGSYGGAWGIPGRVSVEGHYAVSNYVWDALTGQKGRLTPGELYTLHTDQPYDPDQLYTWPLLFQKNRTGYTDERTWAPIGVNQSLIDIGFEQINKAAVWTAVLLENLSRALPPRFVDFKVTNRAVQPDSVPAGPTPDPSTPAWLGQAGAWIDLKIGVNRMDEYRVEVYAVPQAWFKNNPDGWSKWRRKITTGKHQSLWPSDITVNVGTYDVAQDKDPKAPGNDPFVTFARDYDFIYDQMPAIPLKLITEKKAIAEASLTTPGSSEAPGAPVTIASSEVILDPTTQGPTTDPSDGGTISQDLERDPYSFTKTFTWTGEVGNPKGLFSDTMPDGSGTAADYLKDPNATIKTLRDGDYFLLAVVYRKNWRDAFARNQFKILYPDKKLLEKGAWYSNVWSPGFLKSCQGAISRSADTPMIPDELIPFHFDSAGLKLKTP